MLSDEKSLKENKIKVEYNAGGNSVVVVEDLTKMSFTINNDGSLTLCVESNGKIEAKFTLTPLKNK